MIKLHKDDIGWATNTQHYMASDNGHLGSKLLFCVDLGTNNKSVAKRRCEALISLISMSGNLIKDEVKRKNQEGTVQDLQQASVGDGE